MNKVQLDVGLSKMADEITSAEGSLKLPQFGLEGIDVYIASWISRKVIPVPDFREE